MSLRSSPLFPLLLILYFTPSLLGFHIFSQPARVQYQNAYDCLSCLEIIMPVMLETALSADDYLSITLPISIGTSGNINAEVSLNSQSQSLTLVDATTSNEVQFQLPSALAANLWMNITLYFNDSSSLTAGLQGCIEMKTMSDTTNGIIYDRSSCIDLIGLAPQADSSGFSVVARYANTDQNNKNIFGRSYRVFFDITPHVELEKGGLFILTHSSSAFTFGLSCVNTECVIPATDCIENITALSSYQCQLTDNNQRLLFKVKQKVTLSTFRISVFINNPSFYVPETTASNYAIETVFISLNEAGLIHGYQRTFTQASTNPLSLFTAYPATTLTTLPKLFWGLLPQIDTSKDGCPLTLYAKTSIPVYNSIKTEFSLTVALSSFQTNNYLSVKWTLLSTGTSYSTVIPSSIASNLPGVNGSAPSIAFTTAPDMITFSLVGSLIDSITYWVSAKVLLSSSAVNVVASVGGIEIITGKESFSIVSQTGTTIPIRANREYMDSSTTYSWFYQTGSNPAQNFYNFLYTYEASNYNLAVSNSNSLASVYASVTTAFYSSTSKVGVFIKPSGSSVVQNLFLVLYAGTNKICKDTFIDSTTKCSSAVAANGLHMLLKLVFNNNVLGINPSEFPKGVIPVGNLFADTTGLNPACAKYDTASTQSSQLNLITSTTDSAGGVFYHVSLVCKQASAVGTDICHSIAGRTATTISGLVLANTSILTFPTLYADTHSFDFILCFKCMKYGLFESYATMLESFFTLYEDSTNSGGPGVIHGYVLHGGPPTGSFAAYANYYYKSSAFGNSNYIASYLRVSVTFPTNFNATLKGTLLGIFFYDNTLAGLQQFADSSDNLNCVDLASGKQLTGTLLKGLDSPASTQDFWWQHHGVILTKSVEAGSTYNFYIPMKLTSNTVSSVNMVLMSPLWTAASPSYKYTIKAIYKIVGSAYSATLTRTLSSTNTLNLFTDVSSNYNNDATNGCALSGPLLYPGTSAIVPSASITQMAFKSDLGTIGSGTACPLGLNSGSNVGALFAVYSRTQIFSASQTLSWDYSGLSINKCVFHLFASPLDKTKTIYTILCGLDSGTNVPAIGTGKYFYIDKFQVPFYWGSGYAIGNSLQYVWSVPSGLGVSMIRDPTSTTAWEISTCELQVVSSVPISTKDVFYSLKLKNMAKYVLGAGESLLSVTETITSGATSIAFISCEAGSLGCAYSAGPIYTLSNPSSSEYTVNANSLTITVYVDTPSTFNATTHTAMIKYNSLITERCSEASPAAFSISGGQINKDVVLESFSYVRMINARGAFSFVFSLNRDLRKGNLFTFDLGFMSTALTGPGTFHCYVLDQSSAYSHSFSQLDLSDTAKVKLTLKESISSGNKFTFKCSGGVQTPSPGTGTLITSNYLRGSDNVVISSTSLLSEQISAIQNNGFPSEVTLSGISLQKKFNQRGMASDYIFTFRPSTAIIPITGRIYVEFSLAISPFLNPLADFQCYLNNTFVFCEAIDERRVSVTPNIPLDPSSSDAYQLVISGVVQPNTQDSNWKVYFALDNNADAYDGIIEQNYISEPALDVSSLQTALKPIYIKDLTLSHHVLRKTLSLEFYLLLPASTITSETQLYIQFPSIFKESFQLNQALNCSLTSASDRTIELSASCEKDLGTRIRMSVKDWQNSMAITYRLKLDGVLSPQVANDIPREIRVFTSSDNLTVQATSVYSLKNTTESFNFSTASDSSVVSLDYFSTESDLLAEVDIYQGVYRCKVGLGPTSGNYQSTLKWSFVNWTNGNSLYAFPNTGKAELGSKANFISLASDNVTLPGLYLLKAQKLDDQSSKFSDIPVIWARVRKEPCQLTTSQWLYNVPYGGRSAPIVIDFSGCLPLQAVEVTANVTVGYDTYFISVEGVQELTKSLVFSQSGTQQQIIFYATSYSYTTFSGSPIALINFTISGVNAYAYSPPEGVSIQVIDNSGFFTAPVPMTPTVTANVGVTTIQLGCDQIGTLYYSIGIDNITKNESYSDIRTKSELALTNQTFLDSKDKFYRVYGYEIINVENSAVAVTVSKKLKAGANYTVYAYCFNLGNVASTEAESASWTQPDNGGRKFKIQYIYKKALTSSQKQDIACAFCSMFQINPERVLTDEGTICQANAVMRRVLEDNSTNSTTTSNSTNSSNSSNSTSSTPEVPATFAYYWYFARNYTVVSDDLYTLVSNAFSNTTFYTSLMSLTSNSAALPTLNSSGTLEDLTTVSSEIPKLSSSMINSSGTTVGITLSLTNTNGYIYVGVGSNSSATPDPTQLRQGLDGNNSNLVNWSMQSTSANVSQSFLFEGLTNNTHYYLFYLGTNDDPTEDGLTSSVFARKFFTFADRMKAVWILGLIFVIFSFFFLTE